MTYQEIETKLEELMPGMGTNIVEAQYNKLKLQTTWCNIDEDGIAKFNAIYSLVKDWPVHRCTRSGGICKKGREFSYFTHYIYSTKGSKELIILAPKYSYRVMLRSDYGKNEEGKLSGRAAFKRFLKPLEKKGYDIYQHAIENGLEVKRTIPKFDRRVAQKFRYETIEHAFHFDINSAFFAGIAKEFGHLFDGEFGRHIEDIFNHRKTNKYNKDILTHTQGYFQSEFCKHNGNKYALAHMAKAGIVFTCERLKQLIAAYEALGCEFIATNTDGAWMTIPEGFTREQAEQVEGYGKALGEFKIDHWDCKLRYKGPNAYEFIEDGKLNVVLSGISKLDSIKPRDEWEWGDIFERDAKPLQPVFILGRGVVYEEDIYEND